MKRLVAIPCLILLLGAGLFLVLRPAQPAPTAPVILMPLPYRIPPQKLSLFERCVPQQASWAWLWRLKQTIAGRPKVCDLAATVVAFAGSADSTLTNHPLPAPIFTATNGLRVWLLSEAELNALSRSLSHAPGVELLYRPRITTADGMQARLFAGGTVPMMGLSVPVGLSLDLLPRARPDATDVTTIISLTEAITNLASTTAESVPAGATGIQTDFEMAARMQIPKAAGVFLLDAPPSKTDRRRIGILLSVSTSRK